MRSNELANIEIVLYALSALGGETKKIPTEKVAIKCFEIAPSKFSWRLYPQYPDMDAVRVALFDARKKIKGSLVIGRYGKTTGEKTRDGWLFTPKGIEWIEKNRKRISDILGDSLKPTRRTGSGERLREMQRSAAYKKFIANRSCQDIRNYEFTDFLDANLDTPAHILRERLELARALAAQMKNGPILDFLNECEKHFDKLLGTKPV
jgi:hypothetical protein